MTTMWFVAFIRALTSGSVVVLASLLAERLGPVWGALILSLPVTAGPVYVFMALDHNSDFVAQAALNGFAANAATGLFLFVYARRASGQGLTGTLGPAAMAWFAAAMAISFVAWTSLTAVALNVVIYGSVFIFTRGIARKSLPTSIIVSKPRLLDLIIRAGCVAVFVTIVLALSSILGPVLTGVLAAYPLTLTSTFVILHRRIGGAAMARLAGITIQSVFGFGLTVLTLHLLIEPLGSTRAMILALLVSLIYSTGLLTISSPTAGNALRRILRLRSQS